MNKKGVADWMAWGIFILATVLVLQIVKPGLFTAGGATGATGEPISVQVQGASGCTYSGTTVTIGPGYDKYVPTTKTTTTYDRVVINGIDNGNKLDGATMTLSPGDKVTVTYALNDSLTYYASRGTEFEVPCAPAIQTADKKFGDAAALTRNTTKPTVSFFNPDNDKMSGAIGGVNLTINAGQTKTIKVRLEGVNNYGWSAPVVEGVKDSLGNAVTGYGLITCQYIPTQIKSLEFSDTLGPGSNPVQATALNSSYQIKSWKIAPFADNQMIEKWLTVEAHATNTIVDSYVNCTLYDGDWYQDTVTGEILYGVEDNAASDVGGQNHAYGFVVAPVT